MHKFHERYAIIIGSNMQTMGKYDRCVNIYDYFTGKNIKNGRIPNVKAFICKAVQVKNSLLAQYLNARQMSWILVVVFMPTLLFRFFHSFSAEIQLKS